MKFILVVARRDLFPGLSPQGFLPPASVDLAALEPRVFFAERAFMERNSHYKQIIPYLVLQRGAGPDARVLAYQRQAAHSERRLGGLWSIGFGGHIEPLDRDAAGGHGLLRTAARRELEEETGLRIGPEELEAIGTINSDGQEVSSVHFGVVYRVDLSRQAGGEAEILAVVSRQAEPHQARWLTAGELPQLIGSGRGPDGGTFEDWTRIVVEGVFARARAGA